LYAATNINQSTLLSSFLFNRIVVIHVRLFQYLKLLLTGKYCMRKVSFMSNY